jgi:hypothetical protein
MATIKEVVQAFRTAVDGDAKATDILRGLLAGLPPAKREEKIKQVYKECRTIGGNVIASRELSKAEAAVYAKVRKAYSDLFTNTKKGASKRKAGKATVTKVTGVAKAQVKVIASKPKRLSDTLRVILATIQATETPQYKNVPALTAALQVCIDLAV